jgi:hypothetical protein
LGGYSRVIRPTRTVLPPWFHSSQEQAEASPEAYLKL